MSVFTKWLFQNVKREYKVVYIATGFMGNRYDAGIFEIKVSDRFLKRYGVNVHEYGYSLNRKQLNKHFKEINGITRFTSVIIINNKER